MDSPVVLDVWGPNISVKDMNYSTTNTGDLFIVLKICVEPATFLGDSENRRMVIPYVTDSPETLSLGFEFRVFSFPKPIALSYPRDLTYIYIYIYK